MKNKKSKVNIYKIFFNDKKIIFSIIFCLLFSGVLGKSVNYLTGIIVNSVLNQSNLSYLVYAVSVIFGLLILEGVFYFAFKTKFCLHGYKVSKELRNKMFKNLINAQMDYYDKNLSSNIITKTMVYVNSFGKFLEDNVVNILISLVKLIAVFVFMAFLSFKLTLIIFGILLLIVFSIYLIDKLINKRIKKYKPYEIKRDQIIIDAVYGFKTILSNDIDDDIINNFDKNHDKLNEAWRNYIKANGLVLPVTEFLWYFGIVIVYLFSYFATGSISFEIGTVIAFLGYISQTIEPVQIIAKSYSLIGNLKGSINKIKDVLELDNGSLPNNEIEIDLNEIKIEFKNVYYETEYKGCVLNNINLTLQDKERMMLVGKSGSGKSSLVELLSRLYKPTSGVITINGIDINEISKNCYKKMLGMLSETPYIMEKSFIDNLKIAKKDATEDELNNVLIKTGFKKSNGEFYSKIKPKLKKPSKYLSAGEKQMLSFARVLLQNPKIVIIDDALDSLDKKHKQIFKREFSKFSKDKICIYISDSNKERFTSTKTIRLENGSIKKKKTN